MPRHYGPSYYDGMKERKAQEHKDSMMISEDHSQIANLPQGVVMKDWSYHGSYLPEDLDDTIRGVDRQRRVLDGDKLRAVLNPKKV